MRVRTILLTLFLLLALLQYRLWFANGGIAETLNLNRHIQHQMQVNAQLEQGNEALNQQIYQLEHYRVIIKMLARKKFNMIQKNEVYYSFLKDTIKKNAY